MTKADPADTTGMSRRRQLEPVYVNDAVDTAPKFTPVPLPTAIQRLWPEQQRLMAEWDAAFALHKGLMGEALAAAEQASREIGDRLMAVNDQIMRMQATCPSDVRIQIEVTDHLNFADADVPGQYRPEDFLRIIKSARAALPLPSGSELFKIPGAGTAPAATEQGWDEEILELGREFDRKAELSKAAWDAVPDGVPENAWKPAEDAADAVSDVIEKLALLPAMTLEGMRLKARAIAWCHSAPPDQPVMLACAGNTTDIRIAHSIVQDLLQVWAPPSSETEPHHVGAIRLAEADRILTGFEDVIVNYRASVRKGDLVAVQWQSEGYKLGRVVETDRESQLACDVSRWVRDARRQLVPHRSCQSDAEVDSLGTRARDARYVGRLGGGMSVKTTPPVSDDG